MCVQIVDLSKSMMDIAKSRMQGMSVFTHVGDCTALPYREASFDRYVSNMTVHYAPDNDAFLREASRVLAPGGLAGFTVWGREALSDAMTILPMVKKEMGLTKDSSSSPPSRSTYHMGEDDEALRQRVMDAGFSSCVVWHSLTVIEASSAESFATTLIDGSYSTTQEVLTWTPEVQEQFRREVIRVASDKIARGEPLGLDVCYCVAVK
jgi:SAM-dependent methyltransferase